MLITNELLDQLEAIAVPLAKRAGELLLRRRTRRLSVRTKSTERDLVTDADVEAERLILEGIATTRPGDGFVAEERGVVPGSSGVVWAVDPLDGTTNYVHGLPGFVVSIAACTSEETLLGVVFDPIRRETFVASRGRGSTCNGRPIQASGCQRLEQALVATGFSPIAEVRRMQAELLTAILDRVRDVRSTGVCAYELCQVAAGRLDGYYESGLHVWDYAAGGLIVSEAHGTVRVQADPRHHGDLVFAATPDIAEPFSALMR